jgi:hypothetical protein
MNDYKVTYVATVIPLVIVSCIYGLGYWIIGREFPEPYTGFYFFVGLTYSCAVLSVASVVLVVFRQLRKRSLAAAGLTAIIVPILFVLVLMAGNFPNAIGSIYRFNVPGSVAVLLRVLAFLLVPGLARYLVKRSAITFNRFTAK